jgi:hypothetical protein
MGNKTSDRTYVLVDTENINGGSDFTSGDVGKIRTLIESAVILPDGVQVAVATSCGAALVEAGLGWPGARRVWNPGKDGADLALADIALNEDLVGRFDHVVICSGDGLFAIVARFLRAAGVRVTVVSRPEALSRLLACEAAEVVFLPALRRAA